MSAVDTAPQAPPRPRSRWVRFNILIRRIHLYSGLFLLPWVFLYGITGAMFNHQGLFPEFHFQQVPDSIIAQTAFADFPSAEQIAHQVVDALRKSSGNASIELATEHGAAFTNDVMFEVNESGSKRIAHLNPLKKSAYIVSQPKNPEEPQPLLREIRNLQLKPNPQTAAMETADSLLKSVGVSSGKRPQPFGYTKLNFLARVDSEPARVTYVLRDGHVDVTRFTGDDGMTPRRFFLRLHSSHGRTPHWNGRMLWSLAIDTMAIAMVSWGITGIIMWWQLKRTRLIGGVVVAASLATAAVLYCSVHDFYAATTL